ncbi:hypothetical protein BRD18_03445, partial [Halobacteriales archaeon SW_7_71_33]
MPGDDRESYDDREGPGPVRVDHVGIAVESVEAADPVLRALGCEQVTDETVEGRFRWVYYRLGDASRIELVEPVAEDTFLTEFLAANGPGLHHVTLEVADIDAAVAGVEAAAADLEVVDRATFEDWHEAFVSPRNPTGTLFQLIEHREGFSEGRGPPATLFVNGERLAARSTAESLDATEPDEVATAGEPAAAEARERIAADPFCARFGIDLVALGEGRARTRMRTAPWMANLLTHQQTAVNRYRPVWSREVAGRSRVGPVTVSLQPEEYPPRRAQAPPLTRRGGGRRRRRGCSGSVPTAVHSLRNNPGPGWNRGRSHSRRRYMLPYRVHRRSWLSDLRRP